MSNNFVVTTGLTVGPATILETSGDIATTGNVTAGILSGVGSGLTDIPTLAVTGLANSASITAASTNTGNTIVLRDASGNFSAGVISATTSNARYADLAENYSADAEYEPGTVVCFGGIAEITLCVDDGCRKVAGVVSTNPAYVMNSDLTGIKATVALQGRVPCKVTGKISKGDMLVAAGNGFARADTDPKIGQVIGKALEDFNNFSGVIEVVVGRV